VVFRAGVDVGPEMNAHQLLRDFDAVLLAMGARAPRDLPIANRELRGIHFAMEYLVQQNRRGVGDSADAGRAILATGKNVVVIGGGDTGSDCVGTAVRQGAASVTQLELMPKPALVRLPSNPWPECRSCCAPRARKRKARRGTGPCRRARSAGRAARSWRLTRCASCSRGANQARRRTEGSLPCELVLLAMGFVGPERGGVIEQAGLALDARGNVRTDAAGATNVSGVFAAGDVSRGQSLVVWAIADGRRVAAGVDAWLRQAPMARAANG